jgi:hypothetical protein
VPSSKTRTATATASAGVSARAVPGEVMAPGTLFDRYEVIELLGEGGGREVALKQITASGMEVQRACSSDHRRRSRRTRAAR